MKMTEVNIVTNMRLEIMVTVQEPQCPVVSGQYQVSTVNIVQHVNILNSSKTTLVSVMSKKMLEKSY